ncbi:MAG: PAS domain-containing protein [Burkholderiales bacterium]
MNSLTAPTSIDDKTHLDALARLGDESFKTLCEVAPFGIYQTDAAGSCRYTNPQWQTIYGLTLEQSLGDGWAATLHPDDKTAVFTAWQASVEEPHDFGMEFRILRGDGQVRFVRSQARAIRDSAGSIQGYVGAVEDVTDRRLQEDRLRASEASLDRTGRIAAVGGWQVDLVTGAIWWSDQTCRIHGVPLGHRPSMQEAISFFAPQAQSTIEAAVQRGITHGESWDLELPFVSAQGRAMWVRAFGEVEFEAGRAVRLVGALQDITEQHAKQQALQDEQALRQRIQDQAEQTAALLQERTDMLDVLAHEVRQPLHNASAALQSAEDALQSGGAEAVAHRLLRMQAVFSQVLSSVDNTLTAASLLGRGRLEHTSDEDVDAFIALSIADIPTAQRQRIAVQRDSSIRTVSMNMGLMRIALRNLLLNALACSPANTPVHIRLSDTDQPLAFLVDVSDQGPGIDTALLPKLFQRGSRGKNSASRSGYGLGLYIVRRVMELHGGQAMLLRNQPGDTCFRLALTQATLD